MCTQRSIFPPFTEIALQVTIRFPVEENRIEWTVVAAVAAAPTLLVINDHHTPFIQSDRIRRAIRQTLGVAAVLADIDAEIESAHVFCYGQTSQTHVGAVFVEEGTAQHAGFATSAEPGPSDYPSQITHSQTVPENRWGFL